MTIKIIIQSCFPFLSLFGIFAASEQNQIVTGTVTDKIFPSKSDANGNFIGSTMTAKVYYPTAEGNT